MKDFKVVSKNFNYTFVAPLKAQVIQEEMGKILLNLGQFLNYKGKIIGHIKAIAVFGENYLQMSLTSFPSLTVKTDLICNEQEFEALSLTVNIIVFGYSEAELEDFLQESVSGTILATSN